MQLKLEIQEKEAQPSWHRATMHTKAPQWMDKNKKYNSRQQGIMPQWGCNVARYVSGLYINQGNQNWTEHWTGIGIGLRFKGSTRVGPGFNRI
jgi:hypothetical protein